MSDRAKIGLDNPAFSGRLRQSINPAPVVKPTDAPEPPTPPPVATPPVSVIPKDRPAPVLTPHLTVPQETSDQAPVAEEVETIFEEEPTEAVLPIEPPLQVIQAAPFVQPARPKLQPSNVLQRRLVDMPQAEKIIEQLNPKHYSKTQLGLLGLASMTFIVGLAVSLQTTQTNQAAVAKALEFSANAQSRPTSGASSAVPDTGKLSAQTIESYVVAPDLARYIQIPKLNIKTRVMQAGIKTSGALETPDNIHDTAWYTGSAKPGHAGATLINGYAFGGITQGAFFNAKLLVPGDIIEIVRGDGATVTYKVAKSQIYAADSVDMSAALATASPNKSGLNLLVYGGRITPGTNNYSQRLLVFAEQI